MMPYVPTGFPRGRPKKGEVRPPSKNAVYQAEWRKRNPEKAAEVNRSNVSRWISENPEKAKQCMRDAKKRRLQREKQEDEAWLKSAR